MKTIYQFGIASLFMFGQITPLGAVCRKAYVCDDFGMNCRVQDVCDSTTDIPSTGIAPLPPMPSTQIKPLPSIELPPLGTTHCEHKQVNGIWQKVCQ